MHYAPGSSASALVFVPVTHRVTQELLNGRKSALFCCLMFIKDQREFVLAHCTRCCFQAVIMGQGIPVRGDVRQLIPQAVLRPCILTVLLPVLHIRVEYLLMHNNSVALHRRYKRVNDPPFLLAGTVLT